MNRLSPFRSSLVAIALSMLGPSHVFAQTEGEYLYNVTLVRAAPGSFNAFMDALEESFEVVVMAGDPVPIWMRHSQGDHWDFMVLYPMDSAQDFYSEERIARRKLAWNTDEGHAIQSRLEATSSYTEEWFATSISVDDMRARFREKGMYHIEMFAGLPGKRAELLEQRRMENRYYAHLERQQNVIFAREGGSNWDFMTIGFHDSLASFAAAGNAHSAEEQEKAAVVAGFSGTDQIGPYLRSLLSYHNDTIAVNPR